MSNKKILVALTSHGTLGNTGKKTGWYLPEVAHPVEVFEKAGAQVHFVSPKGGAAPMVPEDPEDTLSKAFLADPRYRNAVERTLVASAVNPDEYDAIFFAGGHGTMWDFPEDEGLANLARRIYERGGVVAAVCHGPAALANLKLSNGDYLVKGHEVAAFTDEEERAMELENIVPFLLQKRLEERGARHTKAARFQPHVAVSGRLVTGQNPASAMPVAERMVEVLAQPAK